MNKHPIPYAQARARADKVVDQALETLPTRRGNAYTIFLQEGEE